MTITLYMPDGVEINARQERQAKAALYGGGSGRPLGGRSGFRVDTPDDVLTVTSTTWTLKPCAAMIDPGATAHQGMYGVASDANETGTVDAADATYARKDILYIQINDSSAGDGTAGTPAANVLYKAGTPTATPEAPKLTDPGMGRSFLIGTIDVPAVGAGAPMVTLNKARFVAAGGIQPVWSQSEFDALVPFDGFTVRRMDLPGAPLVIYRSGVWSTDLRGQIAHVADSTESTGLGGLGIVCNSVQVSLVAGRKYRAVYRFTVRSTEANIGIVASIRTSATSDTSTSGTPIPFDQIVYTSARTSSWGACRAEVTWQQGASATVSLQAVLARIVGAAAYDISNRVLYVEDMGGA